MKKLAVLVAALVCAAPVFAGDTGILKLSLWGDIAVAVPNNKAHVTGIDLGIGSSTAKVDGVQLDLIYSEAGTVRGINDAWIYAKVGTIYGVQSAIVSVSEDKVIGVQSGWVDLAHGQVTGVQLGIYNQVEDLHGLQLGLVNNARHISKGLQIGLVNIARNGWLKVLPIVNGHF